MPEVLKILKNHTTGPGLDVLDKIAPLQIIKKDLGHLHLYKQTALDGFSRAACIQKCHLMERAFCSLFVAVINVVVLSRIWNDGEKHQND